MAQERDPVLIVGAGPVGLFMACELERMGISCRIIDKEKHPIRQSKAVGLQARTLEILRNLQLIDKFLQKGLRVKKAMIYSANKPLASIAFDQVDSLYPFILDIPQHETEAIFTEHLMNLGLSVERPVELVAFTQMEDSVHATLMHLNGGVEEITTPWLICCEGAHSSCRRLLGMDFSGFTYAQKFAVVDVGIEWEHPHDVMRINFHPQGVVAFFPLGNKRYRVVSEVRAEKDRETTFSDMEQIIRNRIDPNAILQDPAYLTDFRFHHRQVEHYRAQRIFLLGDAAHIHSPAGGQGLNTGLQDAHNLAWKLALVIHGYADEKLLNSYHTERYPVAKNVLDKTNFMTKMASVRSFSKQCVRNVLMKCLASTGVLQKEAVSFLSEIHVNYRGSPLVAQKSNHWKSHGLKPGDRAPFGTVIHPMTKETIELYDCFHENKFHLLLFVGKHHSPNDIAQLREISVKTYTHYSNMIDVSIIIFDDSHIKLLDTQSFIYLDPGSHLHHRYAAYTCSLYLIRPDGYIGFINKPPSFTDLESYLEKKLQIICN